MERSEEELLRELDAHDALVLRCARGALPFWDFEAAYAAFYPRAALDGHESGPADRGLLEKHAARVRLHREIWEQVITRVTREEFAQDARWRAQGGIGAEEAVARLRTLAQQHLGQ